MSAEELPAEWRGRRVGILDSLLQGRQYVSRLARQYTSQRFTMGWSLNTAYNRQKDPAWVFFWTWLRDDKKEFPGEGWRVKYLRDCQGDHTKAVWKFLDFVAEFKSAS